MPANPEGRVTPLLFFAPCGIVPHFGKSYPPLSFFAPCGVMPHFSLVILVTWLEALRRQMVWEDHLANIYANPQPAEPVPKAA